MKKLFLIIFCLILSGTAFAYYKTTSDVAYTHAFSVRMHYCIPMADTQILKDGGKITRRMIGLKNHICRYSEEHFDSNNKLTKKIYCEFPKHERVEFMRAIYADSENKDVAKELFEEFTKDKNMCQVEDFEDLEAPDDSKN